LAKEIDKEIINNVHDMAFKMKIKEELDKLLKKIIRNNKINDILNG